MPQEGALVGQTLEGYRLRKLLGVGGMAEVYQAEEPSLHRDVAVKVLPRLLATDPNYVTRFRAEARHVANLSHPNIVPVYTFGEDRGLLFLVMPLLKESLRDRMEREGVIAPKEAGRIAYAVASALHTAHHYGIVHRDVKPENILMDGDDKPMLTDFGIAREIDALAESGAARTLAATGLPVGTPEYMAPEQLRGLPATPQVDIYALGAVLYEMLTARVPHEAPTPYEVATAVLRDPVIAPSRINSEVTPVLERVVLMAMARDPANRYPDMRAFAMDLRDALSGRASNTSSLRWTRFMPSERGGPAALPPRIVEGEEFVGLSPVSPTSKGPSLGLASELRARNNFDAKGDISKAPTVTISGGAIAAALNERLNLDAVRAWLNALPSRLVVGRRPTRLGFGALAAGAAAFVLVIALLASQVGSMLAGGSGQTGPQARGIGQPTATTAPTATPSPTVTPRPTATPSNPNTLTFSATTITLTGGSWCQGLFTISNITPNKLTWNWSSSSFDSLRYARWRLDSSTQYTDFASATPSATLKGYNGGATIPSNQLTLGAPCSSSGSPFAVTITDSRGRTYHLQVVINSNN
ncbi:MAG TPA: serine/threonine-protein kinase [Ktedonobacterales bacterium]